MTTNRCCGIGLLGGQCLSMGLHGRIRKYLPKKLLQRYLPQRWCTAPSKALGFRLGAGFRHELREEFLATLAPDRVRSVGVFCPDARASAHRVDGLRDWLIAHAMPALCSDYSQDQKPCSDQYPWSWCGDRAGGGTAATGSKAASKGRGEPTIPPACSTCRTQALRLRPTYFASSSLMRD